MSVAEIYENREIHLTSHKSIVYLIPVPLETGKFEADALKKKMKKV